MGSVDAFPNTGIQGDPYMISATLTIFFLASAAYVVAGVIAIGYWRNPSAGILAGANRVAFAGTFLIAAVFALRWGTWKLMPLTTIADSLNLLVLLATLIMLFVARNDPPMRTLLCYLLPALGLVCLVNAVFGYDDLLDAPRELRGLLLAPHVVLAFLGYALFFVASMTSMAYVFQDLHLKHRQTSGLFHQLPSLEQLDKTLFRLISFGYPFFALTLILGFFWAWVDRDLLGPHWYFSPKIILAAIMAGFYSLAFHTRRFGLLRGRKLAYLVFCGFTSLLIIYVVMGLLNVGNYNFWESAV